MRPNTTAAPSPTREGLNVRLPSPARQPVVSDIWRVAGWTIQFARLGPDDTFPLDQSAGTVHVKVVTGALAGPTLGAFAADHAIRDTRIDAEAVAAGADGAVIAVMTRTAAAPATIHSMAQLAFSGPLEELFQWQSFEEKFGHVIDAFDGADAHIVPGIHLLDDDGTEIAYVHFWTAGKGVDLTTHNHAQDPSPTAPAFAEVHWVFANGTGAGGMYETPEPGSPTRTRYPMRSGQEHGPFFVTEDGRPKLRDNGAVDYPWHGWEAGSDYAQGQAYDFVAAFEINPDYAAV
jgi:hypothetical protein